MLFPLYLQRFFSGQIHVIWECIIWSAVSVEVGLLLCCNYLCYMHYCRGDRGATSSASWGGEVGWEVLITSPWYPVTGCMGTVQSCFRGGSDLTLASISLLIRWSDTETGFPERWLMPQVCQCFGHDIWTMPLIICFNFWSTLKWSGNWTRWSLWVTSNWNTLFYIILFYSECLNAFVLGN